MTKPISGAVMLCELMVEMKIRTLLEHKPRVTVVSDPKMRKTSCTLFAEATLM